MLIIEMFAIRLITVAIITQLHTFRDFDWPYDHSFDEDEEYNFATEKVILSPKQQFLLSYLVIWLLSVPY